MPVVADRVRPADIASFECFRPFDLGAHELEHRIRVARVERGVHPIEPLIMIHARMLPAALVSLVSVRGPAPPLGALTPVRTGLGGPRASASAMGRASDCPARP